MSLFRFVVVAALAGAVSDEPAKAPSPLSATEYVATAATDDGPIDPGRDDLAVEARVEIGDAVVRIYDEQGRVVSVQ